MPNISEQDYNQLILLRRVVHERAVKAANKKVTKRAGDYVIRFLVWLNGFCNRAIDECKNQAWKDAYNTAIKDYENSKPGS
jgi:hypothetical protein